MYKIIMARGLIDIISTSKAPKVVAATEDGKRVPSSVPQVSECKHIRLSPSHTENFVTTKSFSVTGNLRSVYVVFAPMRIVFLPPEGTQCRRTHLPGNVIVSKSYTGY